MELPLDNRQSVKKRILVGVAGFLYHLGFMWAFLWLEKFFGRRHHVVVLTYHHLSDGTQDAEAISELQKGTHKDSFERQIQLFRTWYDPIGCDELESILDRDSKLGSDRFMVTFDDGYLDNQTLGVPCLKKHGAKGIIFIATAYIDSDRRFWWVRLTDSIQRMSAADWQRARDLPSIPHQIRQIMSRHELSDFQTRKLARGVFGNFLAELLPEVRDEFLGCLERFAPAPEQSCLPLLGWDQIRDVNDPECVTIGAHTHTHPLLSKTKTADIDREFETCAEVIKKEIGFVPTCLAYPSGDYNEHVLERVKTSCYDLAFTTRLGTITESSNRYELPRVYASGSSTGLLVTQLILLKLSKYFPRLFLRAVWLLTGQTMMDNIK